MSTLLNFFGHTPLSRRKAFWGLALVAPNLLGLFFFFGVPVIIAFATSLNEWNVLAPPVFTGLDNFGRMLGDNLFWRALGNTVKLALGVIPAEVILALGVALILNQQLPARGIFRTAYFLPVVTSSVAASVVWTWIFQPRYGLLGSLLQPFGLRDTAWLTRPELVLIPVGVVTVWQRLGFDMVLFLAGLQAIPRELYEAATIDGAGRWQRLRYVTLPLLSPTTFLVLTLLVISVFQIFDQVYIMTARTVRGGVDGSALTLPVFLYEEAFTRNRFGYASAVALGLFLIILFLTALQLWGQRLWVYYESEAPEVKA
ncbi:MAG: sugar ABC transporter permease [Anaerolineae bacterium]|nr:sugar ABC transporter permease [Anaerolineae bacterium]